MRAEFTAAECGALKYAANADVVTFDGTAFPEGRGSSN